jgi:hypothetical protein
MMNPIKYMIRKRYGDDFWDDVIVGYPIALILGLFIGYEIGIHRDFITGVYSETDAKKVIALDAEQIPGRFGSPDTLDVLLSNGRTTRLIKEGTHYLQIEDFRQNQDRNAWREYGTQGQLPDYGL